MLSNPLTSISTFPKIKATNFQQFNYDKFNYILPNYHYPLKIRKFSCCCTKFSSFSRRFLDWTSVHGNLPRLASWIISLYLVFLCPDANAEDHSSFQIKYACEDVKSYYASINDLKGKALSRKLNSVIAGHHSLSYKEVWDALKILDAADLDEPEASSGIVEIYSGRIVPKGLAGKPEGWNREHLWPRSYGITRGPFLTDLHNIRPADVNVNSSRGNKYFGECRVGSTHCMKPANKEAASDTETDTKIWAPPYQVRGDVARAVMYMAVRYGFHQSAEGPVLRLSDSPSMVKKEMGLLTTLLEWNELDPPSQEEKLRNERVCRLFQHNRNPFVDHPEYANLIWKHAVSSHRRSSYISKPATTIQR
ncbi:uncharacterized protein LOC104902380 isoform X1 [Beta vulgaris subsp. vulgaris]|uniref:uncharacterized protein LOC104902380 isoform X1 n=1 Tax=Beta vulgaris subsp. vulgaris TaxID=3555 RepID=UPI0020372C83|nr:uncharacterized protein LOC104902380 isoform X1 [Beta vulgaris subsp. vulgaris]XP_010688442.2 uncharacterized protein LOC104902380 isoform X1 [Beta vulgaris subsp. vulgaris]